ncbi:glutathione S-transferase family protein [Jannaschia seohaensis]|uniref:Glutathione S-transferase n=1 Tax=Jannaschia seohaensis TaxID=475081 RepID=A0A2Y9B1G1_9RHOB|nr:glutathione S-transferase family protein [Jannaschia seohaensis]PWJ13821.1 glutathione S-transferase [Jannaschia seohaensis]SSA50334.1 glutathione S-transferase [Jannaschia seohaensis]
MSDIILHHYDLSPFSEKIRLALGYKGLAWKSVKVEAVPPRPLLDALTGGYRRVPVLQVGADVYCDTEVIFRAIERIRPEPSLYPEGEGVSKALSLWWDRATWKPAIGVLVAHIGEHLPEAFLKDRKDHYLGYDISKDAMAPMLPAYVQQMTALAEWLDSMLCRTGAYLTGDALSAADLTCYHSLWLLRANAGAEAIDAQLGLSPAVIAWMDRIAAIGHGTVSDMSPEDAVAAAKAATPDPAFAAAADPSGIELGTAVTVTPDDNARVPVSGTLVSADTQEVVVAVDAPETGTVHVHFPRVGFETLPVETAAQSAA